VGVTTAKKATALKIVENAISELAVTKEVHWKMRTLVVNVVVMSPPKYPSG
jgi:hypothetical protein